MSSLFLCFHLSLRQRVTWNAEQDLKSCMLQLWELYSLISADYGKVQISELVAYSLNNLFRARMIFIFFLQNRKK